MTFKLRTTSFTCSGDKKVFPISIVSRYLTPRTLRGNEETIPPPSPYEYSLPSYEKNSEKKPSTTTPVCKMPIPISTCNQQSMQSPKRRSFFSIRSYTYNSQNSFWSATFNCTGLPRYDAIVLTIRWKDSESLSFTVFRAWLLLFLYQSISKVLDGRIRSLLYAVTICSIERDRSDRICPFVLWCGFYVRKQSKMIEDV